MNVIRRTVDVNGTHIFYEEQGEGFPVVLVSGGGILDRRGWDEQFDEFAKSFRVIRYDVRGLGNSARPTEPFSHSEDLCELLKFLGVERAHVVGLSVGGAIAIDFTLEYPQLVDHLVLAASGLSTDAKSEANLQSLTAITSLTKANGIDHVIELTLNAPFVLSKENSAAREKVQQIYRENQDVFDAGFPLYRMWRITEPPAEERLHEIAAPVLVLKGDKDNKDYANLTDKIAQRLSHCSVSVIPAVLIFCISKSRRNLTRR